MIRRFGEPVSSSIRYTLRPGAYAILRRGKRVLLTHQETPIPEYQLPGGGIDAGESILPALHREIVEETGWRAGRLTRIGAFRRFTYMPEYGLWAEKLCHIYLGRPAMKLGAPLESGHSAIWTDAATASNLLGNPGDAAFMALALKRSL